MRSAKVNVGDSGLASQYNNLRSDAYAASVLLVHQQGTPGMTLYVEGGTCYVGATKVTYAGGNTPTFTAPVTNPRIDIVTIDNTGTIAITQGSENVSPVAPTYPANKLVLAEIYNRTGETAIYDTDQGTKGYISNDVRPFVGGSYIASDAQVGAGAAIKPSKMDSGNVDADWLPDATNTRSLGSSGRQWSAMYATTIYQNGVALAGFGGSGADGALSISSGTTTLDCATNRKLVKQYTSISITGTGALAFINPNTNGTLIVLMATGNVTLTSSAAPMINASSMGAAGAASFTGSGNLTGITGSSATWGPVIYGGGIGGTSGGNGAGGTTSAGFIKTDGVYVDNSLVAMGGGGGSGGLSVAGTHTSGGGGIGGGCLHIYCGGTFNFTTSGGISVAGGNGINGDGASGTSGGGGGGGGLCIIRYKALTANSGTITVSGGSGGSGPYVNAGGGGCGVNAAGSNGSSGTGGAGGVGLAVVSSIA